MLREWLSRRALRTKVTVVVLFALAVALGAVVISDAKSFSAGEIASADHRALLVADFSAAPLSFGDREGAANLLSQLDSLGGRVRLAALYDGKGRLFASYSHKPEHGAMLPGLLSMEEGFNGSFIKSARPVDLNGVRLGSVVLISSTEELNRQIRDHLLFMLVVFVVVSLLAFLIVSRIEPLLTRPIVQLAESARSISNATDLSLRVTPPSEDEVGELYRGFNQMLERLQVESLKKDAALEDLRRSEERFREIVHDQTEVIVRFDPNGIIKFGNDSFNALIRDRFGAQRPQSFFEVLGAKSEQSFRSLLSRITYGTPVLGGEFPITGGVGEMREWSWIVRALFNEKRVLDEFQAVGRDVTQERSAARERLELAEKMQDAQRLQTIGTLAGGIAHDFNNLLTPISGYAQLCLGRLSPSDPIYEYLQTIGRAGARARDLIGQILTFSGQRSSADLSPISMQGLLDETFALLRATVPVGAEFKVEKSAKDCSVWGDRGRLTQVLVNLCANAFQALPQGSGTVTVGFRSVTEVPSILRDRTEDFVELYVSDTGEGMSAETKARIFEPFFTTKSPGKGTGLGLSVVHGIVREYEGAIEVDTAPERGTTFRIYLPITNRTESGSEIMAMNARKSAGHILFVDDEEFICELGKDLLEELGFTVEVTSSPVTALQMIGMPESSFDLVISDVTMPEMSGLELAERIRKVRPHQRILLTTGYAGNSDSIAGAKGQLGIKVLHKPYSVDELESAVRELLDGESGSSTGAGAAFSS